MGIVRSVLAKWTESVGGGSLFFGGSVKVDQVRVWPGVTISTGLVDFLFQDLLS